MVPQRAGPQEEDDLFAEVHDLEAQQVAQGHADGVRDGMVAGILEGRELGLQKGYEIGVEVGFYAGCVRTWRRLQAVDAAHRHTAAQGQQEGNNQTQQEQQDAARGSEPAATNSQPASPEAAQSQLANITLGASSTSDQPAQPSSSAEEDGKSTAERMDHTAQGAGLQQQQDVSQQGPLEATTRGLLIPERAEKALTSLEQLLAEFPLTNPQDERLHDMLERIRGRFKAVASMLGLLQDYLPRESDRPEPEQSGSPARTGAAADLSF